jgi:S1-C subfamily serine protease
MTGDPTGGTPQPPRRLARSAPYVAGAAIAFGAVLLYSVLFPSPRPLTQDEVDARVNEVLASVTPPPAFSELVYQAVLPSVVLVQVERPQTGGADGVDEVVGSGVVVNLAGDMLTSLHVVADATEITVTFADGTRSPAEIVAEDAKNDIAVLRAAELHERRGHLRPRSLVRARGQWRRVARSDPGGRGGQSGQLRWTVT